MIGGIESGRSTDRRYYECRECLSRASVTEPLSACPDCGGRLRNIAVARE
jgi:rRNA maturation endonuclease Nob1